MTCGTPRKVVPPGAIARLDLLFPKPLFIPVPTSNPPVVGAVGLNLLRLAPSIDEHALKVVTLINPEKLVILIVDDDPLFLEEARTALMAQSDRGVFLARDAKQAWDLVRTVGSGFSVALIDLDLPDVDGFQLIAGMRNKLPDLPIIAITGAFPPYLLESAKMLGAVEILQKPISPEWQTVVKRIRDTRKVC